MHNRGIDIEKEQAIQSDGWRHLLEVLFPDKTFDGQFQNPGTEEVFDFDDRVMIDPDPFGFIANEVVYYPPNDDQTLYTIFIPGLGQSEAISSRRSRRYAERLLTGIANLNNGSYLKQNPILTKINPLLDWVEATIHRMGLSGSLAIKNCAQLALYAISHHQVINFSADSHGTILLGRGLQVAKRTFIAERASPFDITEYLFWEKRWEVLTHQFINVVAFGNGYRAWVKGPKYIMIFIEGDPLTSTIGINPKNVKSIEKKDSPLPVFAGDPLASVMGIDSEENIKNRLSFKRDDIQFLTFEPIFEPGNFEAHNMVYTIELLRQSFIKNNLEIGNFLSLYHALRQDTLELVTAAEAKAETFPWPDDMEEYTWNATGAFAKLLGRLSA